MRIIIMYIHERIYNSLPVRDRKYIHLENNNIEQCIVHVYMGGNDMHDTQISDGRIQHTIFFLKGRRSP